MAQTIPNATPGKDCQATEAAATLRAATARDTLRAMRAFRDKVLARSKRGRELIEEYNVFTPRVLLLFILEPSLRQQAGQFIEVAAPIVDTMLPRRAQTVVVTEKTVDVAMRFVEALIAADRKHKNDGNLAQVVRARLAEIKPQTLVGLTGRELQQALRLEPDDVA